jgi:hypothetical protein
MRPFPSDVFLLGWAAITITGTGVVICHRFVRVRGLELLVYGTALGIGFLGLLGVIMAAVPSLRLLVIAMTLLLPVAAAVYWIINRIPGQLSASLSKAEKWSLGIWLLFCVFCLLLSRLNVPYPAKLPDGLFIFKRPDLNVKIQRMASLPADNYIPFVVTEYFLRQISFSKEHPVLPGQEVSNRTILMSLVALPFRAALSGLHDDPLSLGTFRYVGREWPDVGKLNTGHRYEQSLVLGLLLNSLLLPGLLLFISGLEARSGVLIAGALLFATSAYFIVQSIYIWPKSLAAFFIVLAWHGIRRALSPAIVALCAGLAYHSHPSAVVYAVGAAGFYLFKAWQGQTRWHQLIIFVTTCAFVILPWFLWNWCYLHLPSNLIQQNMFEHLEHTGDIPNVIWVRLHNLFELLTPVMFGTYPFTLSRIVKQATFSLPGAIGLLLIIPAYIRWWRLRSEPVFFWLAMVLPTLVIVFIFSFPRAVALDLPAIAGALLFLGVMQLRDVLRRHAFHLMVAAQLLCNLSVWYLYWALWQTNRL